MAVVALARSVMGTSCGQAKLVCVICACGRADEHSLRAQLLDQVGKA